jgi:hypothetical protein
VAWLFRTPTPKAAERVKKAEPVYYGVHGGIMKFYREIIYRTAQPACEPIKLLKITVTVYLFSAHPLKLDPPE